MGPDGVRRLKVAELYRESGADHLTLAAGEVLAAVVLPPQGERRTAYAKGRIRDAIDFALAGVAVALRRDGDVIGELSVAITGTNSAPLTVPMGDLIGRSWDADAVASLARSLRATANVLRTTTTGAIYRRRTMQGLARRLVDTLWNDGVK
jgi:4-hydroxybenzoyl-CoA reductase subunit beta